MGLVIQFVGFLILAAIGAVIGVAVLAALAFWCLIWSIGVRK